MTPVPVDKRTALLSATFIVGIAVKLHRSGEPAWYDQYDPHHRRTLSLSLFCSASSRWTAWAPPADSCMKGLQPDRREMEIKLSTPAAATPWRGMKLEEAMESTVTIDQLPAGTAHLSAFLSILSIANWRSLQAEQEASCLMTFSAFTYLYSWQLSASGIWRFLRLKGQRLSAGGSRCTRRNLVGWERHSCCPWAFSLIPGHSMILFCQYGPSNPNSAGGNRTFPSLYHRRPVMFTDCLRNPQTLPVGQADDRPCGRTRRLRRSCR